jgi:hypothetical protein
MSKRMIRFVRQAVLAAVIAAVLAPCAAAAPKEAAEGGEARAYARSVERVLSDVDRVESACKRVLRLLEDAEDEAENRDVKARLRRLHDDVSTVRNNARRMESSYYALEGVVYQEGLETRTKERLQEALPTILEKLAPYVKQQRDYWTAYWKKKASTAKEEKGAEAAAAVEKAAAEALGQVDGEVERLTRELMSRLQAGLGNLCASRARVIRASVARRMSGRDTKTELDRIYANEAQGRARLFQTQANKALATTKRALKDFFLRADRRMK